MEIKNEKQMVVTDNEGKEHLMQILFTYDNEERGTSYVFFYDTEDKDEEVVVMRYLESGELEPIEDDEEYDEVEEVFNANGAEMSRREKFIEGSVPLHTLRADIDFYVEHAQTIAGIVGVKVWIYKGEK